MYNGRLVDAQLFSRLLLLWYNPTTEGESLRHCLGMFFSTFGAKNELVVGFMSGEVKTLEAAKN